MTETHESETKTVLGLHILSGEDVVERALVLKEDYETMTILIEGSLKDGEQHINITAAGPDPTLDGLKELGDLFVSLGEVLVSPDMAQHYLEGSEEDKGATDGE
jgi:hypothetical protein